jgi:hypothetical protein
MAESERDLILGMMALLHTDKLAACLRKTEIDGYIV